MALPSLQGPVAPGEGDLDRWAKRRPVVQHGGERLAADSGPHLVVFQVLEKRDERLIQVAGVLNLGAALV